MLSQQIIEQAAIDHLQAEMSTTQGKPLSIKYPDMTLEDGYAIQKSWVNMLIAVCKLIPFKLI